MNIVVARAACAALLAAALGGCASVSFHPVADGGAVVGAPAGPAELARQQALRAQPAWSFAGRVAITRGRDGGSGRLEWQQRGQEYEVQLSAPVTRQSWRLIGNSASHHGRLEGLAGGTRQGEDAQQLLLQATAWQIPVNQLVDWVRGMPAADAPAAALEWDADGRPLRFTQLGWQVHVQDWAPAQDGVPALPRRIEAVSGDAKVRLLVDSWSGYGP